MSRLVTMRYEYAQYDSASGVLTPPKDVPPTYPPTLDSYKVCSVAALAQSYGTLTVVNTGSGTNAVNVPAGSTVNICSLLTNTSLVGVTVNNAIPVLNGTPTNLVFYVGAGGTITIPGSINSGTLTFGAYNVSLTAASVAFTANVMWSL